MASRCPFNKMRILQKFYFESFCNSSIHLTKTNVLWNDLHTPITNIYILKFTISTWFCCFSVFWGGWRKKVITVFPSMQLTDNILKGPFMMIRGDRKVDIQISPRSRKDVWTQERRPWASHWWKKKKKIILPSSSCCNLKSRAATRALNCPNM